jgi:hypothetical protein
VRNLVSLSLREEQRLRLFGNMMRRKTFGPRCEEVTGEWNKLHQVKLMLGVSSAKYYAGDRIKDDDMDGACGMYRAEEKCT